MYQSRVITNVLGKSFLVSREAAVPVASNGGAVVFSDVNTARSFIRQLRAPENYWRSLLRDTNGTINATPVDIEKNIATLLVWGKIRIVEVPSMRVEPPSLAERTIEISESTTCCFYTITELNGHIGDGAVNIRSQQQAAAYLEKISLSDEKAAQLVNSFELNAASLSSSSASNFELLSIAMVAGSVIAVETTAQSTPPVSSLEVIIDAASSAVVGLGSEDVCEEPVCSLSEYIVKCAHSGKRNFQLDMMNGEPNFNGSQYVVQVVDAEDINLQLAGNCVHGNPDCPSISIAGPKGTKTAKAGAIKFKAEPNPPEEEVIDFGTFLKKWFVPDVPAFKYQEYRLESTGCSDIECKTAIVHCFPKAKWNGEISLGYGRDGGDKKRVAQGLGDKGKFQVGGKITVENGDKTFEVGGSGQKEVKDYFPGIINFLADFFDKLEEIGEKSSPSKADGTRAGLFTFNIGWPKVAIGGGNSLEEKKGTGEVGFGGEVYVKLAPLLSAEVKTDILEWLITVSGPHAPLLLKVKRKAEEGFDSKNFGAKAKVAVELSLKGSIDGEFKWSKNPADKWISTDHQKAHKAKVGLTIGLDAVIKAEGRAFMVKVTLGAGFYVKGAENEKEGIGFIMSLSSTVKDDKPAWDGDLLFTGCAIYYSYYLEVSRVGDESDKTGKKSNKGGWGKTIAKSAEVSGKKEKVEKLATLFEPKKFFEESAASTAKTINTIKF